MLTGEERMKNVLDLEIIRNIFDALEEGVFIVDRDCRILFYNKTLSRFEGLEPDYVLGKSMFEVFPSITPLDSTLYQVIQTGRPIIGRFQQYINFLGREIKTVNTTIPIVDNGEVIGALEVSRDISVVLSLTEKVAALQQAGGRMKRGKSAGIRFSFDDIVGQSKKIREIIDLLKKVSRTTSSVLIYGETGTGKELFAQSIHAESPRRGRPFIAQNCAALPESLLEGLLFGTTRGSFTGAMDKPGLFEQADGGTILLDEINSMGLFLQAKILRVLQEGTVRRLGGNEDIPLDVRVIATTNVHPAALMKGGRLREDLFYRLSVIFVEIPPLRERAEDIEILAEHFVNKYNQKFKKHVAGLSRDLVRILREYGWPGNVRELEHVIEALMNFVDEGEITPRELSFLSFGAFRSFVENDRTGQAYFKNRVGDYEKQLIIETLRETGGNIAQAAKKMEIKRQALQYKLKKYNIKKEDISS
ncbi:MAG: sigma-54 interaction domain-containing protein [Bacillota bacterium]